MSYLMDTNVISELVKKKPDNKVVQWFQTIPDDKIYISVLTLGEICHDIDKMSNHIKTNLVRTSTPGMVSRSHSSH